MYADLNEEQRRIVDAIVAQLPMIASDHKEPAPQPWTVEEILAREG